MSEARITFRERPKGEEQLYCLRRGTRAEIDESAHLLLEELRGEGFARAAVFIDGRRARIKTRNSGRG